MYWRNILPALAAAATTTSATNLFIADYGGTVTSASLTEKNGKYDLKETFTTKQCAPNPSWLTIDVNRGLLFCLNEGLETVNGSLSSFTINSNGRLDHVKNATAISGPVNGVIYGNAAGQRGIALAHYSGSAVSSWLLDGQGRFELNQRLPQMLSKPGPDARQLMPHEHEAILDPTGQYILVPDLGADLVRVFSWDKDTLKLTPKAPLQAKVKSGPRHAAFWNPFGVACEGCTTFMYLVAELGSTVTGYAVEYLPNGGGLSFSEVYTSSTYGTDKQPKGNAPAEVHVAPDNKYLIISNRNNNPAVNSLTTFALQDDGKLKFHQLAPTGWYPRHFSTNAIGTLVAVGLQFGMETVILARDPSTGKIGKQVASLPSKGNVTCVMWDEEKSLGVLGG